MMVLRTLADIVLRSVTGFAGEKGPADKWVGQINRLILADPVPRETDVGLGLSLYE